MDGLLDRLFESSLRQNHSLNYIINRLANYIVLNLSKKCHFLKEIGVQIEEDNINLIVNSALSSKELFDKEFQELINHGSIKRDYDYLLGNGKEIKVTYTYKPFSERLIKKLSQFYFIPEKSKNRYIYKYCSFNKNLISLLTTNSLWFSDPASFNDPFDCRYSIDADPLDGEVAAFYYNTKNVISQGILLHDYANEFQPPSKQQFLTDLEKHHFVNSFSKGIGVCCFSEKHNDRLMWAHYAENVAGLCLVFDTSVKVRDGSYVFSGYKVRYRNSLVKKFYDGSPYFEVTDIVYSKNKVWQYEREIREVVNFEKGETNRTVAFDPNCLVGIISGARMSENDKRAVTNLISKLDKYKVEFIDSHIDFAKNRILLKKNKLKLK